MYGRGGSVRIVQRNGVAADSPPVLHLPVKAVRAKWRPITSGAVVGELVTPGGLASHLDSIESTRRPHISHVK